MWGQRAGAWAIVSVEQEQGDGGLLKNKGTAGQAIGAQGLEREKSMFLLLGQ